MVVMAQVMVQVMVTGLMWLHVFAIANVMPTIVDLPSPSAPSQALLVPSPAIVLNKPSSAHAVEAARQDLAQRLNMPVKTLRLASAQAKTWQDGCLGLATHEEVCIQVLVPGWRLEFTDGQTTWVYRTNQTGTLLRLESTHDP